MSPSRALLVAFACALSCSCTLIHIDGNDDRTGVESDAFISGFATAGWTDNDPLLNVDLLENALISIDVWKLLRVQVGLVGASVGVGPFDAGIGVLFYEAKPPRYRWSLTGNELDRSEWAVSTYSTRHRSRWHEDHDDGHGEHGDHDGDGHDGDDREHGDDDDEGHDDDGDGEHGDGHGHDGHDDD